MKMQHRTAVLCTAFLLGITPAAALSEAAEAAAPAQVTETPAPDETIAAALGEHRLSMLDHYVAYPQIEGMADEALMAQVNGRILEACGIEALLNRLPLVIASPTPLQADYQAVLTNGVLSVVMDARGPVTDGRATQVRTAVNLDLLTGSDITLAELFDDEAAAREAIEALLEDEIAPTLSAHLLRSELTPMPDVFAIDAQGLTLYYPIDRLCTLSGRAGAINLRWCELSGLRMEEGGILDRIGAIQQLTLSEESLQLIAEAIADGMLPGIPARLDGSMKEATDTYRMLIDPDLCEAGRMFALEDAAFRDVWLLTDALSRSWDQSVIQGIRADRINLYGLCAGVTQRSAWLEALGEPAMSVTLACDRAEAWRLPNGVSDYYLLGVYRLRLHSNEVGTLTSIFLTH